MLVKFFKGGTGQGASPVEYLTRETDSRGVIREPLPEIIKGNPKQTIQLIDSLDFKYKFHSGVISFAPSDEPTEEQQKAIIDSFEETAFAGLEADQYDILWVKHSHTSNGRVELHFVTPRVELTTGKSLSIAPPGWQDYYCHWRDIWNYQQGWASPDDPTRARTYQPGYQALRDAQDQRLELAGLPAKKKEDYRKIITNYITENIRLGNITNRTDIIKTLKNADIEVTRIGTNYITITNDKINQKIRLKGGIYNASWRLGQRPTTEIVSGEEENRADIQTSIREAEAKLKPRIA
ncbi:MAG: relaxase/mobilization nuclease domain-containing protein, partial [Xenococcus sp. (in: cyanobacteria)]